jgi:hypothetical protein
MGHLEKEGQEDTLKTPLEYGEDMAVQPIAYGRRLHAGTSACRGAGEQAYAY